MKDNTKKTLQIYWKFVWRHKLALFIIVFSIIGASIANLTAPLFYKRFFDILGQGQTSEQVIASLVQILKLVFLAYIAEWIFWRIATFIASNFNSAIYAQLSDFCFNHLHKNSFSFFENSFVGSLVKKVKYFVNAYMVLEDSFLWNAIPLITNVAMVLIVLSLKNAYLGLGIAVWMIIYIIVSLFFAKYKIKYDILRTEAETEASAHLADTVTNSLNVKLFNGYAKEIKSSELANAKVAKWRRFVWNLNNSFDAAQSLLSVILEIAIFYIAIRLWQENVLTLGDFVLIQAYILNIIMRIWNFGRIIRKIYESLADAEEMTRILTAPIEIKDIAGAKDLQVNEGKIEFKNVVFNYKQTRSVINQFNLAIKPGEKVAVIGSSGAGKTTLAKLLLRLYDLTGGKIIVDGQNIAKVAQESLWRNISLVPQDPILFHRPLIENIRYGKPNATEKEVIAAAKAAHCHEFISELAEGYNTYVGERGIKLSGGERQRVAIARAILRNAPILVLDEATSSLDSESEKLIQEALVELMKNKTVIVIAHRLSTIRKMDRIVVIDKGRIIEEGTHQKLTEKKSSIYKKLWQLQAGGFIQE